MKNNNTFAMEANGKEVDIDTWEEYQNLLNN